jgi:hypothetical protein
LQDEVVTIVSNKAFPDKDSEGNPHPHARKITALSPDGVEVYILPRLLSERPVEIAGHAPAPVITAPVVTQAVLASVTQPSGASVVGMVRQLDPITDPMDPRLDHLRPSRRKWNPAGTGQYIQRDMGNGLTDVNFLLTFTNDVYRGDANNAGRPASVLLKGDTQSGKTMLVECLAIAWADKLGLPKPMPIFTISGSAGVTDFDLFGQTTSYTDPETGIESLVWLPGMVELATQVGGILYLDEVNALDPRVTSSLHPIVDHRHYFINRNKAVYKNGQFMPEVAQASADLWVIGTYNESYQGMGKLNEAFVNRFEHICWSYDGAVEQTLVKSAAIRLLGDALRTARERNSVRTPIGTAALQRCVRNVQQFGAVIGLNLLISMFGPAERPIVESIVEDRSIIILLNEELRQAEAEAKARS